MFRAPAAVGIVLLLSAIFGCGSSGTPKIETVTAPAPDPLAQAKSMLTNYAKGMPVTSEAASFPDLIEKVKAKDAAKGELLDKGLNQIKDRKSTRLNSSHRT